VWSSEIPILFSYLLPDPRVLFSKSGTDLTVVIVSTDLPVQVIWLGAHLVGILVELTGDVLFSGMENAA
jgi:hypothetical protein